MAGQAEMKDLGIYMMDTLRIIFEMADRSFEKFSVSYADVKFEDQLRDVDGKSFIERSRDSDGRINMSLLEQNTGQVISCGSFMKDRLIRELDREKISRAQVWDVITVNGKPIERCNFIIDVRDREKAKKLVEELNRTSSILCKSAKEFAENRDGKEVVLSSVVVESDKLSYMERLGNIRVPHCVIKIDEENSRLYFEEKDKDEILKELKEATLVFSANSRLEDMKRDQEKKKEIENIMANFRNDRSSCVLYDAYAPDHYMIADSKGIRVHFGNYEQTISRLEPEFENKLYEKMIGYGKLHFENDVARNPELARPENFEREYVELTLEERIMSYKRQLVHYLSFRLDNEKEEEKEQARANEVKFKDNIEKASRSGNQNLEIRLKDDLTQNQAAKRGDISVNAVDMADMHDSEFVHAFCMRALSYATMKDGAALAAMLEEAKENPVMIALASEDKSVKVALINEIEKSIEESKQITYDVEHADTKEILTEVEREQSLTISLSEREFEK